MGLVGLQAGIANPCNILMLFQPVREFQRIVCVSLTPQTQRFDTQEKLLRSKGVQSGADIS